MFYSEKLLSKTGPLAEIWLASHVERRLNKQKILQQNIASSVEIIIEEVTGPMALRMTGSLMLGVVKIYGRKARYLLDDCNEALLKIRMTFKATNNHDLPNQGVTTTSINLQMPEQLTIDDLFPALDFNFNLTQPSSSQANERDAGSTDEWASTLEPHTQTPIRDLNDEEAGIIQDDDLGLDLGEDVGMDTTISMQMGRGEQPPLAQDMTDLPVYDDGADDLGLDLGEDVGMADITAWEAHGSALQPDADDETAQIRVGGLSRDGSLTPEANPAVAADADGTFLQEEIEEDQVVAQQRQTNRRAKAMQPDRDTVIHNSTIKAQNVDRSKILKSNTMLPQDPELLALMDMQRNGEFVTNAMNDGHGSTWAPEIQGLLSFDLVYRAGQKRKRDSGIADIASEDEHSDKSPRLDRNAQADEDVIDEAVELRGSSPRQQDELMLDDEAGLGDFQTDVEQEDVADDAGDGGFDDTTMPLVHPADSGPISVSTQHAVHVLRDVFGADAPSTSSQTRKSVLLQDLIPEKTTSKAEATKMFFETLVLATKDAIKVEQASDKVGVPIRVRAKRGLWGAWAADTSSNEQETEAR